MVGVGGAPGVTDAAFFICHTSVPVGLLLPQVFASHPAEGVTDVTDIFLMFYPSLFYTYIYV